MDTSREWLTRQEAADYLRIDVDTLDARLSTAIDFQIGKIRYRVMVDGGKNKKVRVWSADVFKMLPKFEEPALIGEGK